MLNRIIAWCLGHRLLVVLGALAIGAWGAISAQRLPIDVLPDLNRPMVSILTEAHGMIPEEIERQITLPLERALNGATGVTRVRSSSSMGMSIVTAEFEWGTDPYRNRQIVQEKLQLARRQLPEHAVPEMAPMTSIMGQVQIVGLRGKGKEVDPARLRTIAERDIRLRLLSVPGIATVILTGGAPLEVQAVLDAGRLRAHQVDVGDVVKGLSEANENASGGLLRHGPNAPMVTVTGRARTPGDLADAVVKANGTRPVRVADVGEVTMGPAAIRVGDAGVNAAKGVLLIVTKQPGIDTLGLTARVDAELAAIAPTLPDDVELVPGLYRQADFINRAVHNVEEAVRDGALLVVIVLVIFLLNLRTTFITLTAIPLSLAITTIVFHVFGISINTMTLGGLAVAIGALVDDAIVDVENVFRRLRQNAKSEHPQSPLSIVFRASAEVRQPILIGTLVVITVYIPLFAMSGMEGRLFAPIGLAYIISIVASLVVAVTVTPVLCSLLLPTTAARRAGRDGAPVRGLQFLAEKGIRLSAKFPIAIATLTGALVVVGLAALATRGTEFLPPFNEGSAQINLVLPPDTSIDVSDDYGRRLEAVVAPIEGVAALARRTGRAEGDAHAMGVNITEMIVSFDEDSGRSRDEIVGQIREVAGEAFPGVPLSVEQPLAHLLSAMLSGVQAQVAIKIFGEDLPTLRRLANEVEHAIEGVDGVTDLMVESQVLVDQVRVDPDREQLARLGLTIGDVTRTIEQALEGSPVGRFLDGAMAYPIVVRLRQQDRESLDDLRNLLLATPHDTWVRLGDVADIRLEPTPNAVNREDVSRRIIVHHNVAGRSLGEVVADVQRALMPLRQQLPPGYAIRLGGQFEAQESAARTVFLLSFVSLGIMFLVLALHFRSVNLALQVLLNIPAAFIGAVAFLLWTDQTLSIATLVGFVSLGGIASRNGILLLDHYLHLMKEEGVPFGPEMLVQAGRERIVPVLMTALTSGIALIPLVISPDQPGRELLYPVASVIVGGLVSTTLLDVLLTPGVFQLFGRPAAEAYVQRKLPSDDQVDALAAPFEHVEA